MPIGRAGLLFAALLLPLPGRDCRNEPAPRQREIPRASPSPVPAPKPDLFVSSVRPVLSTRCAPCHEPGGKMYDRLPFDRAEVVARHRDGVLRRIRAPEEREAIERWLAESGGRGAASAED